LIKILNIENQIKFGAKEEIWSVINSEKNYEKGKKLIVGDVLKLGKKSLKIVDVIFWNFI